MVHYTGNIYNFNPIPKDEYIRIDIPFFEQNPISDEILIQLDDNEIINKTSEQYHFIKGIPESEKQIIRKNGINVEGQLNILKKLRSDIKYNYNLICWSGIPKKDQLEYVLTLGWNYLIAENESKSSVTLPILITCTKIYCYGYEKDIQKLVDSNFNYYKTLKKYQKFTDQEILDDAIRSSFHMLRHWFEYKIPKWLSVIDSLQKFICSEFGLRSGNYSHFANLIENDFLREDLSILTEYGIPSSAIRKLEKIIPPNKSQDEIIDLIKQRQIYDNREFLNYEISKLNKI
ncbi:hypothetical protein [Acinetobacter tandoii]|uniref:hypothetical protein n=1 Tax=Acinetobacter tandoii TaxID=202954 RepID=UPI001BC87AB8|nr:hypothetical protein [Acinetobacter tandoii]